MRDPKKDHPAHPEQANNGDNPSPPDQARNDEHPEQAQNDEHPEHPDHPDHPHAVPEEVQTYLDDLREELDGLSIEALEDLA